MELCEEKQSKMAGGSSNSMSGNGNLAGIAVILSIITPVVGYANIYIDIVGWIVVLICLGKLMSEENQFEKAGYAVLGLLALAVCKAFPVAEFFITNSLMVGIVFAALAALFIVLLYCRLYYGIREMRQR